MRFLITAIPNLLMGFLTASAGFGLETWQFWAIAVPFAIFTTWITS